MSPVVVRHLLSLRILGYSLNYQYLNLLRYFQSSCVILLWTLLTIIHNSLYQCQYHDSPDINIVSKLYSYVQLFFNQFTGNNYGTASLMT